MRLPVWTFFRESSICKICQLSASENHRHLWIDEVRFFFSFKRGFYSFSFYLCSSSNGENFFFKRHPILLCTPHISILVMSKEFRNPTEKWVEKVTQNWVTQIEKSVISLWRIEACSTFLFNNPPKLTYFQSLKSENPNFR